MTISADDVTALVDTQLALISDTTVVAGLRGYLVSPSRHLRSWDYGKPGELYPCWTVAQDPPTDTGIVYSEHGFGPEHPWGLVFLSKLWFGMDCGWFKRLSDAYIDSFAAADLPIWNVVEKSQGQPDATHYRDLSSDEAFRRRDELAVSGSSVTFHVAYRGFPEDRAP